MNLKKNYKNCRCTNELILQPQTTYYTGWLIIEMQCKTIFLNGTVYFIMDLKSRLNL